MCQSIGMAVSSGASVATKPRKIAKPSEAKDIQELATYMYDNYDIRVVQDSFKDVDFENVKLAAQGVVDVIDEFPGAKDNFHELRAETLGKNTLACASFFGEIKVNNGKYQTKDGLDATYKRSISTAFHPEGTTSEHITSHEAGHILERALIDKYGTSRWEQADMWNRGTLSGKIISEAAKAAKKTPDGKGLKIDQLRRQVSGYAMKNRQETLAECVADYVANREKAKPLSREVWKILKRELG